MQSILPYLAEFIGTALLILLGNGVVANVVLPKRKHWKFKKKSRTYPVKLLALSRMRQRSVPAHQSHSAESTNKLFEPHSPDMPHVVSGDIFASTSY